MCTVNAEFSPNIPWQNCRKSNKWMCLLSSKWRKSLPTVWVCPDASMPYKTMSTIQKQCRFLTFIKHLTKHTISSWKMQDEMWITPPINWIIMNALNRSIVSLTVLMRSQKKIVRYASVARVMKSNLQLTPSTIYGIERCDVKIFGFCVVDWVHRVHEPPFQRLVHYFEHSIDVKAPQIVR